MKPTHFNAFMQVVLHCSSVCFMRLAFVFIPGQPGLSMNWIFLKMSVELRSTNGMPNCVRTLMLFFKSEPEFAELRLFLQPPCVWMAKA